MTIDVSVYKLEQQYYAVKDILLSKQWPITQGRVTKSEHGSDYYDPSGGRGEYGYILYYARISYRYTVGSKTYEGEVYIEVMNSSARVDRFSEKYPERSQINVYYNPENPALSIVEPGHNLSYTGIIFYVISFSISLLLPLFVVSKVVKKIFKIGESKTTE